MSNVCDESPAVGTLTWSVCPFSAARYSIGQKRCQVCEIFLRWDGLWCPCCGYRLRTSPRNSKFKAELRARKEMDKISPPPKHTVQSYTSSHVSKLIKNILHTKRVSRL